LAKITTILILTFWTLTNCLGQTASIKIVRQFYDNSFEKFDSIQFQFNGVKIFATDTLAKQIPLNYALDYCIAIIGTDTIHFLTKLKPNNEYTIRPGCCCAAFILEPKNNARRGTVTFKNTTKRDLGLIVAEANIDTVKVNVTRTTFSYESAMCLFKPCSILITEPSYFSDTYNYKNDGRDYDTLWKEQAQFILTKSWFHFLHGEKIELDYNDKTKVTNIRLVGYMTEKEYENIWK
jgi:hypothetical protein